MPTKTRIAREQAAEMAARYGHLLGHFTTATGEQIEAGDAVRGRLQASCACGLFLTVLEGEVTETGPSRFATCPVHVE